MATPPAEILSKRFRAGQGFELVVFDRLTEGERASLASMREDASFYGVLRPRTGNVGTVKTADHNTALLWLTLQAPGQLPFFVAQSDPGTMARLISQFVLDGVLEVEIEGRFVSGAAAMAAIGSGPSMTSGGILGVLSREALRHGEALYLEDPEVLAGRLYSFGSIPLSPRWEKRLGTSEAVETFLGISVDGLTGAGLGRDWRRGTVGRQAGWISFSRPAQLKTVRQGVTYKLYVSPRPESLPDVLRTAAAAFAKCGGSRFKVGGTAAGVLRPDKLVFYFDDLAHLQSTASELAGRLDGTPVHGVPFSAAITGDGLLSWGVDPPTAVDGPEWLGQESWRSWVTRRLATALIAAQGNDQSSLRPWEFALERLRHSGVDVETWTPSVPLMTN